MDITLEEFTLLRDFIYEKTGIYFEEKKAYFLNARIANRLAETNSSNAKEYYRFLKYENSADELKLLINLITTNETYFFRDTEQMTSFADEILPAVLEEKRKNNERTIRIWSAACSTGDEPYSIAILIRERMKSFENFNIEILASDINTQVLKKCEEGIYTPRALKDTPKDILNKYFNFDGKDYKIHDDVKKMITLKCINLIDSAQVRKIRNIDVLFCRNVLIYFDDNSKKQTVNDFYDVLSKDGFVLLGVGESLGRISASFKLIRLKKIIAYKK